MALAETATASDYTECGIELAELETLLPMAKAFGLYDWGSVMAGRSPTAISESVHEVVWNVWYKILANHNVRHMNVLRRTLATGPRISVVD